MNMKILDFSKKFHTTPPKRLIPLFVALQTEKSLDVSVFNSVHKLAFPSTM